MCIRDSDESELVRYCEDPEWAYRALKRGFPIHYLPQITVTHLHWRNDQDMAAVYSNYARSQGGWFGRELRRGRLSFLVRVAYELGRGAKRWTLGSLRGDYLRKVNGRAYVVDLLRGLEMCIRDRFCPSGFVNAGPGNRGTPDDHVYLFGTSPAADARAQDGADVARTYLARVDRRRLLSRSAYEYFAGVDAKSRPRWTADLDKLQPVFVDRNRAQPGCAGQCKMSSSLEEAVYDAGLRRYIGVAPVSYTHL